MDVRGIGLIFGGIGFRLGFALRLVWYLLGLFWIYEAGLHFNMSYEWYIKYMNMSLCMTFVNLLPCGSTQMLKSEMLVTGELPNIQKINVFHMRLSVLYKTCSPRAHLHGVDGNLKYL